MPSLLFCSGHVPRELQMPTGSELLVCQGIKGCESGHCSQVLRGGMPEFFIRDGSAWGVQLINVWLIVLVAVTSYTDLRFQRIRNIHTAPSMLAGILLGLGVAGVGGAGMAVLGILCGFASMGILYALGIMKAGDVKLAMAVGALVGPLEAVRTVILSFVLYLPVGLVYLTFSGNWSQVWAAMKGLGRYLYSRLHPALAGEPLEMKGMTLAPFGMVLGVAALLVHFLNWLGSRGFIPQLQ